MHDNVLCHGIFGITNELTVGHEFIFIIVFLSKIHYCIEIDFCHHLITRIGMKITMDI